MKVWKVYCRDGYDWKPLGLYAAVTEQQAISEAQEDNGICAQDNREYRAKHFKGNYSIEEN